MSGNENARVEVFHKIFDQLNTDPPSYTDKDGSIKTYTILASYPEVTPVFPCIVVNSLVKKRMFLGVAKRPNFSAPGSIDLDYYAKSRDGKQAIDVARDKVEMILANNWITNTTTVDTSAGVQLVTIAGVE